MWNAITDAARFPSWRSDVTKVEQLPPTATGPSWREHSRQGAITMVVDVAEPPRKMIGRIADEGLPYGGKWIYEIEPDGDAASRVTITEDGSVYNPIFRFVSRFIMGHTASIDAYLRALGRHFGAEPTPTVVAGNGRWGYETKCRARVDDRSGHVREADATVLLETDELVVRGEARVKIPRDVDRARDGTRRRAHRHVAHGGRVAHARRRRGGQVAREDRGATRSASSTSSTSNRARRSGSSPSMTKRSWRSSPSARTIVSSGKSATGCDVVFVGVEAET